jgi:ADP-heptose:LPS heptosyltransferase
MNIMIFRVGSIGDSIVALDAFNTLRQHFENSKVYLLCDIYDNDNSGTVSSYKIFEYFNMIDGYFSYGKELNIKKLIELNDFIKKNNIKKLYYLMPKRNKFQKFRDFLLFKIYGLHVYGIELFKKDENEYKKNSLYEFEGKRLLRKIKDFKLRKFTYDKIIKNEEKNYKELTICIGTKHQDNDWGYDNWLSLIKLIYEYDRNLIINFIGGANDIIKSEKLKNININKYNNACNKITFSESIEIINKSKIFIGHDSGAMHLASLVKTNIVSLFSYKNKPGIWYPNIENIHIYRAENIKEISYEAIFELIVEILNKK